MAGSSVLYEGEFGYLLNGIGFDEEFVNELKKCVSLIEVSPTFSCSFCCETFKTYRSLSNPHISTSIWRPRFVKCISRCLHKMEGSEKKYKYLVLANEFLTLSTMPVVLTLLSK